MRREICGECDTPINDDGSCICTELPKHGWRQRAKGQKVTQWCQMAEEIRRAAQRIYLSLPKEIQGQLLQSHRQDAEIIVGLRDVEGIK